MTVLSGWRATLAVMAALVVLALLVMAFFWLAALAAIVAAVAAFNVLAVPRLSRRLHVSELVIVGGLLVLLAAGGWLVGGATAAAAGIVAWLLGVVVPRLVLRQFRRRLEIAELRAHRGRPLIVDLEAAPVGPGLTDDNPVVTFRRRD